MANWGTYLAHQSSPGHQTLAASLYQLQSHPGWHAPPPPYTVQPRLPFSPTSPIPVWPQPSWLMVLFYLVASLSLGSRELSSLLLFFSCSLALPHPHGLVQCGPFRRLLCSLWHLRETCSSRPRSIMSSLCFHSCFINACPLFYV